MSLTPNDIGVLANFLTPRGFEKVDISGGGVVGLSSVPDLGEEVDIIAIIQCEDGEARYRDDGNNPTANEGFVLFNPIPMNYTISNLSQVDLRFIQPAAIAGYISPGNTINVLYYTFANEAEVS